MEKYIRELLQDHDRVIIPNFGGFLKSKGEINTLIFNEFIKFNDGQLINYVAKQEDVPVDEASSMVDKYAEDLKSKLSEGREVKIKGVGVLFSAENGRIRFKSDAEDISPDGVKKKREPKAERLQDKKPEKNEEPVKEEQKPVPPPPKPVEKKPKKRVPTDTEKKKPVPQSEDKSKKPAPVPEKEEDKKPVAATTASGGDVPSEKSGRIRQPDPRKMPPPGAPPEKEKRKKRSPLVWILPLLLVLIFIVWVAVDFNNLRGYFHMESDEVTTTEANETVVMKAAEDESAEENPENEAMPAETNDESTAEPTSDDAAGTESQTEQLTEADEAEQQSTSEQTAAASPAEEESSATEVPSTPPKKYHLIAGVFGEKENAVELVNKLKNEGYYAELIGFINNMYYVSYNSFKSKTDARYEWERLKDKGLDAWLYYY